MAGVLLGSIQFTRREIPETIPWSGKQQVAVHKQLGGQRVIDAMGPDPRPIQWSGMFFGPSAATRARAVDALLQSGTQVNLSWGSFSYVVIVVDFHPIYRHEWEIRYSITCEVVTTGPVLSAPNLDQQTQADLTTLNNMVIQT